MGSSGVSPKGGIYQESPVHGSRLLNDCESFLWLHIGRGKPHRQHEPYKDRSHALGTRLLGFACNPRLQCIQGHDNSTCHCEHEITEFEGRNYAHLSAVRTGKIKNEVPNGARDSAGDLVGGPAAGITSQNQLKHTTHTDLQ